MNAFSGLLIKVALALETEYYPSGEPVAQLWFRGRKVFLTTVGNRFAVCINLLLSCRMAIKKAKIITRKILLEEIEEKLQSLNLLKSALLGDPSRKQEDLEKYRDRFHDIINFQLKK